MSDHPDMFGHVSPDLDKWSVLWSAKSDEWATDWDVVKDWALRIGEGFNLDVSATAENTKASLFYTLRDDALTKHWALDAGGGAVWCNCPYSNIDRFVAKAFKEAAKGCTVVMLLPARTDRSWFHFALARTDVCEIYFCRGRLRFGNAEHDAPFPSVVFVIRGPHNER